MVVALAPDSLPPILASAFFVAYSTTTLLHSLISPTDVDIRMDIELLFYQCHLGFCQYLEE
jgi:hypothetical protein